MSSGNTVSELALYKRRILLHALQLHAWCRLNVTRLRYRLNGRDCIMTQICISDGKCAT